MPNVHLRAMRAAYQKFDRTHDISTLMAALDAIPTADAAHPASSHAGPRPRSREDLHRVCFDFVCS